MIVQCDKCKTKFRIADHKLTEAGVKVRCSRCAHVFVVRADGTGASQPPLGDRVDTARVDASALASLAASTQPNAPDPPRWSNFPAAGITEQSSIPGLMGARPGPTQSFPPNAATSSQQLAAALGFGGAPPPPPPPLPPTGADFSEARTVQTKVGGLSKAAAEASLPPFPGPKTPSGAKPPPLAIPKAVTDADPSVRFPPPPDLLASLTRDEEIPGAATEMNLPGVGEDFLPPEAFPPPPPSSDLPALYGELGPPPEAATGDPFAGIDLDGPKSSPFQAVDAFDPNASKSTAANEILARIDLGKAALGPDGPDPFGELAATAHAVDSTPPSRRSRPRAATVPALPQLEHRVRNWPTLLGVVAGLAVALFVYPGVGPGLIRAVELRSLDPVFSEEGAATVLPDGIAAVRALAPVVTRYPADRNNGLIVVTGSAENTGTDAYAGLDAVVLWMDGEAIKGRERAPLGLVLDAGALAKILNASDLPAAWAEANARQPEGWRALAPGQVRPFMVVFPPSTEGLDQEVFRVEFTQPLVTSDAR